MRPTLPLQPIMDRSAERVAAIERRQRAWLEKAAGREAEGGVGDTLP
ncbi:MAG: hypothetical protein ACREKI_02100 [Gemmatimonadota bacterium]